MTPSSGPPDQPPPPPPPPPPPSPPGGGRPAKVDKRLARLLEPGEVPYATLSIGVGTKHAPTNVPEDISEVVLTDSRLLFATGVFRLGTWRSIPVADLARVDVDTIAAGINRSRQYVVTFDVSGASISGVVLAAGGGKGELRNFLAAMEGRRPGTTSAF